MYLHQNVSFDINFSVEEGNFQYEIDNMLGLSFHFFPVFFSPLFIVIFVILHLSRRPAGRPSSAVPHKASHGTLLQGRALRERLRIATGQDHCCLVGGGPPPENNRRDNPQEWIGSRIPIIRATKRTQACNASSPTYDTQTERLTQHKTSGRGKGGQDHPWYPLPPPEKAISATSA